MMAVGLGIALPIDLAIGSLGGAAGLVFARYATAPLGAAGLLGAAACLVEVRRSPGTVRRRLTDVGRTALSCYVLQNIICSALCYGWGFGLAAGMGDLRTWWTLLLYAAVCTLVALAHLWLRRFPQGPQPQPRPGWAESAESQHLRFGERVRLGAEQLAVVEVEQQQH